MRHRRIRVKARSGEGLTFDSAPRVELVGRQICQRTLRVFQAGPELPLDRASDGSSATVRTDIRGMRSANRGLRGVASAVVLFSKRLGLGMVLFWRVLRSGDEAFGCCPWTDTRESYLH